MDGLFGLNLSLTFVLSLLILIGATLYFIFNLPSILPVINVVLAVIYFLFVLNIIQFKFDPKAILLGSLLILFSLSVFQTLRAKNKACSTFAVLQLLSSFLALLIYLKLIVRLYQ
jgi:hypothetical protein